MIKVPGDVSGDIFTYQELADKLDREIERLQNAEQQADSVSALDHALNAAFTGFHLLEWEEKENNPSSEVKARALLEQKNNSDLNLLHDIVTKTKHMTIGDSPHKQPIDVRVSAGNSHMLTIGNDGQENWERSRKVFVKFGDEMASSVLLRVWKLFKIKYI